MRHFAQDTSIRRGNAFDRAVGAIDIPFFIHGNPSFRIGILGCYLSVCKQLVNPLLRSYETSLTVGCRIDIYFSKLSALQPGRLVGNHLGVYHLGNVTVDRIKGQGRRIVLLSDDFAVRNQTELN